MLQSELSAAQLTTFSTANALALHYPLTELFSRIPEALRPKITRSIYHQQKGELTIHIPMEGSKARSVQEERAWDTLMTIIDWAALSVVEVNLSKGQKAKVIEL